MDFYKFLASNKFGEQETHASIVNRHDAIAIQSNTTISHKDNIIYVFLLWMIILYTVGWASLEVFHKFVTVFISKKTRKLFVFSPFQSPCRKCQFFDDNNYLNCAVHPSVVLTNKAANCSDYEKRE